MASENGVDQTPHRSAGLPQSLFSSIANVPGPRIARNKPHEDRSTQCLWPAIGPSCPPLSTRDLAIDRLTSKQRAHLRSLAHDLDPVVRVGKEGLTDAVKEAIVEAFNTRELLKVRVLDASPKGVRGITDALDLDDVQVVQVIGHVAILYRPDPEEPVIELP